MKWSIFKLLLAGGMAGMTLLPLCAQNDSIAPAVKERRWDKREHLRYDERWERLKPTHLKWQYAGGMGLNSVGVGWDYGRRCQWETDCQVGFLPAKYAEKFRLTFTVKQNYIPWSICFKEHWMAEPFYCGLCLVLCNNTQSAHVTPPLYSYLRYARTRSYTLYNYNVTRGIIVRQWLKSHGGFPCIL